MKKRWIFCLAAALLIAALCIGCGQNNKKEEASGERTTLTVGFDASFPPYGYQNDDGDYVGFDLDLAAEVAKRNGWELILQPIDWDAKDMELNSGTIDLIWNGFTINGRENDYTWSPAYVDNSQVFVVKKDSGITTFADLAGKEVVVQADSSALAALQDEEGQAELAKTFNLTQVPEYNTAFMNLESGASDAVALDIGVAKYQMESRDGDFVMLEEPIAAEQYGIGFKKGNEELRDIVWKTVEEMVADGTFMTIAEKWDLHDSVAIGR